MRRFEEKMHARKGAREEQETQLFDVDGVNKQWDGRD
jgi:hypothetical protein